MMMFTAKMRMQMALQNMLYILHNGSEEDQRRVLMQAGKWCKRDGGFVALNFDCEGCTQCEGKHD